jgi:hypothetical protein
MEKYEEDLQEANSKCTVKVGQTLLPSQNSSPLMIEIDVPPAWEQI